MRRVHLIPLVALVATVVSCDASRPGADNNSAGSAPSGDGAMVRDGRHSPLGLRDAATLAAVLDTVMMVVTDTNSGAVAQPVMPILDAQRFDMRDHNVHVAEGAFTAPGAREAVVSCYGTSVGSSASWLLRYDRRRGWRVDTLIVFDSDSVGTIDIQSDGIQELIQTTKFQGKGVEFTSVSVFSLNERHRDTLFHAEGVDHAGNGMQHFDRVHVEFIQRDGAIWLAEHRSQRKRGDLRARSTDRTYRFTDGKFVRASVGSEMVEK